MANKYAKLDACLLEACSDIKALFNKNDLTTFRLHIECRNEGYDDNELSIKYTVQRDYDNGPHGNDLDEVIKEYIRRQGWDITNNAKRISGF